MPSPEVRCRLIVAAIAILLLAVAVFSWDWVYGGWSLARWVIIGVYAGFGGAVTGTLIGIALTIGDHGSSTLSRQGCGSCDRACCNVWWRDAFASLVAFVLSLTTAAAASAVVSGLLALLLLGLEKMERAAHADVPGWVHQYLMYIVLASLSIWFLARNMYKTQVGWYTHGEMLFDDNAGNDIWVML